MKYYLHDTNSFDDEKITQLYIKFGYEGLGLFYTLLEKLAKQEKPIRTDVLKEQLKIRKKLEKCWKFLEEIDLISTKNGETFNKKLLNFSETFKENKEKNRKKVSDWRDKQADTEIVTGTELECNAPKGKVRYSNIIKEKYKKEKDEELEDKKLEELEDIESEDKPPKEEPDPIFLDYAKKLAKIIQTKKQITHTLFQIKKWAVEFKKVHIQNGVSKDRIENALEWYEKNIGGEFIPEIESGSSFRIKFSKIETAMDRQKLKPKVFKNTGTGYVGHIHAGYKSRGPDASF